MQRDIQFPKVKPRYVFERECLGFRALVDDQPIECLVSGELLKYRFGARAFTEDAYQEAFATHETAIHAIARHHIEMGWINSDNQIVLTTRFTTLKVEFSDELRKRPRELEVAQRALRDLAKMIGPGSGEVRVDFDWEEKEGQPVIVVHLKDASGRVANHFSKDDMEPPGELRLWLNRLWGDFLQIRVHKLIQQLG